MRPPLVVVVAALALSASLQAVDGVVRTFDTDAIGVAPPGFTFAAARLPGPGQWLVRGEGAARYAVHLGDTTEGDGFALALLEAPAPGAVRLSARVKLSEGTRVGGLVWRYAGPDDFYAVSLDLRAQAAALYRVTGGNRVRLELEDDLELDPDAWHVLRLEETGRRVRVTLGGIGIMRQRLRDEASGPVRAGVWSAGATTAWFDDLQLHEVEARRQ